MVRGQTTGEINYISWDTLVRAVEGGSLKVAELVDRKKDYEIHVKWSWGYVTDPQTGKVRDCCYLDPAPDPASGEILRKIDAWSALLASLRQDDSKLIDDDFRLDDVKVKEDVELSADMEDRMKYSPVHVVSRH